MVYELRCYTLVPGKMPDYLKAAETSANDNNFEKTIGHNRTYPWRAIVFSICLTPRGL